MAVVALDPVTFGPDPGARARRMFRRQANNDRVNTTGIWQPEEHTYGKDTPGGTLVRNLQGAFSAVSITARS